MSTADYRDDRWVICGFRSRLALADTAGHPAAHAGTEVLRDGLPAISGWRITAEIVDHAAIGQARLDYLDIHEPGGFRAFNNTVYRPGAEARMYRHKLMRARQDLVRQRAKDSFSRS